VNLAPGVHVTQHYMPQLFLACLNYDFAITSLKYKPTLTVMHKIQARCAP